MKSTSAIRTAIGAAGLVACCGHAAGQEFPQAFDNVGLLLSQGRWFTQNNSSPLGVTGFFQGDSLPFGPHASQGYLATNFENTGPGVGTISNWFMTPALNLENGKQFSFFTRTVVGNTYPDRLQVRMSTSGFSTQVGATSDSVGDFETLLLDVNPTYQPTPGGYPETWTEFTVTVTGLPGPAVGRFAFRYFAENGGPAGVNANYIGIDSASYTGTIATIPTGACCLPDATCIAAQTQGQCAAASGVYQGDGSVCGPCMMFGFMEAGDVGDVPATARVLTGSGDLLTIMGTIGENDVDMYRISVCDRATFSATTHGGPAIDSLLYLFSADGHGVTKDDESGASGNHARVTGQFLSGNGEVYLAISTFERDAVTAGGARIWQEFNPLFSYEPEWAPNGPGAAGVIAGWQTFFSGATGPYAITLSGACFVAQATCYANCDGSSVAPVLTANDFQCFINKYAGNDPYANCDGSTALPALTANDFQCFINKYAGGCS